MKPYKKQFPAAEFNAYIIQDNPSWMRLTIEGKDLYTSCDLHMKDIIKLHTYLKEEIEHWLTNNDEQ